MTADGLPEESLGSRRVPSRRMFLGLALGAPTAILASVAAALGPLLLAPLLPLLPLLAPVRRRGGKGPGKVPRVDIGPASLYEPIREGIAGPREVVIERSVEDGYMGRRVRERVVVVSDPSSPAGLAVLSTTCSHLGCGVSWSPERKVFLCPCHGGVYTAGGAVLAGPPPRPLERLSFVVDGGHLSLDLEGLV